MLCFGVGVLLEEKIDGEDVSGLSLMLTVGGGALAGFAAYISDEGKKKKTRRDKE